MKPHLNHIRHTLIRKQRTQEAGDTQVSYRKYRQLVEKAKAEGYSDEQIITELKEEAARTQADIREGDALFLEGIRNAKESCVQAINLLISELESGLC